MILASLIDPLDYRCPQKSPSLASLLICLVLALDFLLNQGLTSSTSFLTWLSAPLILSAFFSSGAPIVHSRSSFVQFRSHKDQAKCLRPLPQVNSC